MRTKNGWVLIFLLLMTGCQSLEEDKGLFKKGRALGANDNRDLPEASGLVASITNPGMLWTLNDSGNPAEIFLIDTLAKTRKTFQFPNIKNRDWEDITLGNCPGTDRPCLYIGDIGDNSAKYPFKLIYRIPEPSLSDPEEITTVETFVVKLSDGQRDTETLMADPITNNLYIVSKREDKVMLYEIESPFKSDTLLAQKVATLAVKEIVAGSISPDGNEVLLKSYAFIYYWKKKNSESIVELLLTKPVRLPYKPEPTGESIAWARDVSGYYTLSENSTVGWESLYFYKRK